MRKTTKSTFKSIILGDSYFSTSANATGTVIIDLIALCHQLVNIPDRYDKICALLISMVKKVICDVDRVDFVADNYTVYVSPIKKGEHAARGESNSIIIKSLTSKTAANFKERILRNPTNKTRLVELFIEYVTKNSKDVRKQLGCTTIYISAEGRCHKFTEKETTDYPQLESNQPEADTRLILHARDALQTTDSEVYIYSPSADTDVVVLCVALLHDEKTRVHIIDGSGKRSRVYKLSDITVDEEVSNALIGLYAFTGNDFVSSLFGIGKVKAYKQMMSDRKHLNLFSGLGESIDQFTIEKQLEWAEAFVCKLYSEKQCNTVNEARYELFKRKLVKNKTVSLSKIPPCKSVLKLHLSRSAYVAYLWRRSQENQIELPPIDEYGWFLDGNIVWTDEEIFPTTVAKYIEVEDEHMYDDEDDDIYSETESDDDEI